MIQLQRTKSSPEGTALSAWLEMSRSSHGSKICACVQLVNSLIVSPLPIDHRYQVSTTPEKHQSKQVNRESTKCAIAINNAVCLPSKQPRSSSQEIEFAAELAENEFCRPPRDDKIASRAPLSHKEPPELAFVVVARSRE